MTINDMEKPVWITKKVFVKGSVYSFSNHHKTFLGNLLRIFFFLPRRFAFKKRKTERRNKEHRITTTIKQPKQFQTIPTSIKKGEKQTNNQKETQPTSKQNTCSQHRVSLCFHGFDIPSCCSVGIFVNSQGIRICSVIALAQAFLATQPEYSICYLENGPFFWSTEHLEIQNNMTHTHRKINIEPKNLPYVLKKKHRLKKITSLQHHHANDGHSTKNIQGLIFSWTTLNFRGASRNHHLDTMLQVVSPQQQAVYFLSRCGFSSCLIFSTLHFSLFFFHTKETYNGDSKYIYIYDPGSRFATTPPPPPPMVWSQNLRFAAFCMKTWYLQCFLHGGWLARSANLQIRRISCNQLSENVLFAMFRLRHRGVVPLHPPLCRIII